MRPSAASSITDSAYVRSLYPIFSRLVVQRTMIALNNSEASHPSSQLRTRG